MNDILMSIIQLLWLQSWQLVILVLLVWPIASLSQRSYPRFSYSLWLMVAVKTAIPMSFQIPINLPITLDNPMGPLLMLPAVEVNTSLWQRISLLEGLGYVWFLATAVFLTRTVVTEWLYRRRLDVNYTLEVEEISRLQAALGLKRTPRVAVSSQLNSPLTMGILNPLILLPKAQERWSKQSRLAVIAHEMAHIKRRDLVVILLQVILKVIFFFHPLMYLVNRKLDLDRERICDEMAVAALQVNPTHYGRELLAHLEASVAAPVPIAISGGMFMNSKNIVKRFEYLINRKGGLMLQLKSSQKLLLGVLALAMVIISCSGVGTTKKGESEVIKDPKGSYVIQSDGTLKPTSKPPPPPDPTAERVDYDTPPEPVGGYMAIQKAVVYPELAQKAGIEGTVIVQAIVRSDGKVQETYILRGVEDAGLNESAMNALKGIKWIPAMADGKPVTVKIAVPVVFRLKTG